MKIRNEIKIACEGLHCLILLVMISPVRRALVGVEIGRAHVLHEVSSSNPFPGSTLNELSNP